MASGSLFHTVLTSPFGLGAANPQGSNYAAESGFNTDETNLLAKEIKRSIFDAAPAQYNVLKLLFSKNFDLRNSDEHEYLEQTFERTPLEAQSGVGATAASPGNIVTQTIALTAATTPYAGKDLVIVYPDNTKGTITAISGSNITVSSQTSKGLPAVTAGDVFSIESGIYADAMSTFNRFERAQTITRFNYIQFFLRARRWGAVELQKYKNTGTTNYLDVDKKAVLRQLRTDLFSTFINGTRGEYELSTGEIAKSMGGVFPLMQAAGSTNATVALAGLRPAFEAAAFASTYLSEGSTRFVIATNEMLYELSKQWKDSLVRYTPDSRIGDLNLDMLKIGNQNYVFVATELFKERSVFPASFARRILCLDMNTIQPVIMKGFPAMNMVETPGMEIREGFKDYAVWAQLGMEFNNPLSSFWIDVI